MPDKPNGSKKDVKEANVTETSAKKSDQKPASDKPMSERKYSFSFAPLLLGALIIALLAGIIGYGASQNRSYHYGMPSFHDRMMDDYSSSSDFDRYRSAPGGMYDTNKRLHGIAGEVDSVSDTEIVIKPLQGGMTTFKINSATVVTDGSSTAKVSDLTVGDNVTIQPDQSDPTLAYKITIL